MDSKQNELRGGVYAKRCDDVQVDPYIEIMKFELQNFYISMIYYFQFFGKNLAFLSLLCYIKINLNLLPDVTSGGRTRLARPDRRLVNLTPYVRQKS